MKPWYWLIMMMLIMITKITMLIIMIIVVRVKNGFFDNDTNNYNYNDNEDDDSQIMIQKFFFFSSSYPYVKFNCKDYILLTEKAAYIVWYLKILCTAHLLFECGEPRRRKKKAIITVKLLSLHFLLQRIMYINWLKLFFDNSASLKTSKFNFF